MMSGWDGGDYGRRGQRTKAGPAAWYPTALLPSQGVRWEPVDDHSAYATLTEGTISVTMLFAFNDSGLIDTVRAEARRRMVSCNVVPTPWQGRFWNYIERDGMRVPHRRRGSLASPSRCQAILARSHH